MKGVFKFFFWLTGWKIIGDVPRDEPKYIVIAAPHTSNWDFLVGVAVRGIMGFRSKYLGKSSLFKPPFGWFFRWLGGYPVDRSKRGNLVEQVIKIFDQHKSFVIALAPEGTRKNVSEWRTGFYHIANGVGVPIVPSRIDRRTRRVTFFEPFWPTGDIQKDLPKIKAFYQ
jgi:1-acyl-sn-glycerol-3-phosphate acyltransferase